MQNDIQRKLEQQLMKNIDNNIRSLEKRIFAQAQTIHFLEDLSLDPPDYGVGAMPKLTSILNNNEEAEKVISECLKAKKKLLLLKKLIGIGDIMNVLKCLTNNQYVRMSEKRIEEFVCNEMTAQV